MLIGIHSFHGVFNHNNSIFNSEVFKIGENLEYSNVLLKKRIQESGHEISTLDLYPIDKFSIILFYDYPEKEDQYLLELSTQGKDLYLIILESPIVRPENWNKNNHKYFKKIFTWNNEWVDNKKYFLLNISNKISNKNLSNLSDKTNFCVVIAGNKYINHRNELYSERIKAIKWIEKKHPDEFDLYGIGWDSGVDNYLLKIIKKSYYLQRILIKIGIWNFIDKNFKYYLSSYKGKIEKKIETLKKYKFSICYENAKGYPGYITEKIFDCFLAGCVPVYLGAPNITDYIPANTFIDKRNFKTYEELYDFMKYMTDNKYSVYLNNIENFLISNEAAKFSAENFANTVVNEILKDIKVKEK